LQSALANAGFAWKQSTSREFAAFLRNEIHRWTPIVEATGFRLD
jgi:hypothetical protein